MLDAFNNIPKPPVTPPTTKPVVSKEDESRPVTPAPLGGSSKPSANNNDNNALALKAQFDKAQFQATQQKAQAQGARFDFTGVDVSKFLSGSTIAGLTKGSFSSDEKKSTADRAVREEFGSGKLSEGALSALSDGVAANLNAMDDDGTI